MAFIREKNREIVFQALFAQNFYLSEKNDLVQFFMPIIKTTKKNVNTLFEAVDNILLKLNEIDEIIKNISKEYNFNRISKVELNIIRLCIYEIKYDENIPAKVAIAEAIRLCKKFSSKESSNFVNAIVDEFYKNYEHTKKSIP
jgi:N utilization substance protein B